MATNSEPFSAILDLFLHEPTDDPFIFGVANNPSTPSPSIEVALAPLPPSDDPLRSMVGFRAPEHWDGVGVVAPGKAHSPDGTSSILVAILVDRSGEVFARLRNDDGSTIAMPDQCQGRLPDLCRRILAVGCPPPEHDSPHHLFITMWLSAILEHVLDSPIEHRPGWNELEVLHPAAQLIPNSLDPLTDRARTLASEIGWEQLRLLCADDEFLIPDVEPADAEWFDEGSFSRWVIATSGWMGEIAGDLIELLDDDIGARLAEVLETLLTPNHSAGR